MNLQDLVKQWAAAEPDRCKAGGGYLTDRWMAIQLDGRMRSWIDGWSGGQKTVNEAVLLAAVIQAIEARGWHWDLGHATFTEPPIGSGHHAMVRGYVSDRHSEGPAAALLDAYLGAIAKEAT